MSEAETQIKPPATKTGTPYVVLRFNPETDEWFEYGNHVRASSATAAIRDHVGGSTVQEGVYVAIPARSFRSVTVKAEQTVTLKLEQAT